MNELSPDVLTIKDELSQAIRRDHQRRTRHRKTLRTGAFSAIGVAALSSAALAASGGAPVEEVQLAHGVSIESVKSFPEFNGHVSGGFVTSASKQGGSYFYHVTGGEATGLGCGPTDPHPTNNVYILSTRPLSSTEIAGILLPNGEPRPLLQRPAGVLSVSNGCPNPGVAGQPGDPNAPAVAGKGAVTVVPSNRVPEILSPEPNSSPAVSTPTATAPAPSTSTTAPEGTGTTP